MKLEGKLKAIIMVTCSDHMGKYGSREELTQLCYKQSSYRVNRHMGAPVRLGCWGRQERFKDGFCVRHHSVG